MWAHRCVTRRSINLRGISIVKFELVGKKNAKLVNVDVQAQKLGQKDLRPALLLRFKLTQANDILAMFAPTLRPFLFEKNSAAQTQGTLDGVPVVSDLPQLTEPAKRMGVLSWDIEQGGSKLVMYRGATGRSDITLKDGTVSKFKIEPLEGGTVDVTFDFYVADLDAETMGDIAVLHQHELDIELIAPEVMQQGDVIEEDDGPAYTPEQALADSVAEEGTAAQGNAGKRLKQQRRAAKKAPLAKKVARSSRKAKAH
jgi:hypothetical protein